MPVLESLPDASPCPFTITSNTQLRRLRALTGDDSLQPGDTSAVGFSLKHDTTGDQLAAEHAKHADTV